MSVFCTCRLVYFLFFFFFSSQAKQIYTALERWTSFCFWLGTLGKVPLEVPYFWHRSLLVPSFAFDSAQRMDGEKVDTLSHRQGNGRAGGGGGILNVLA